MSELVGPKGPCPDCGSSDGLGTYDDGHTFCFSCSKNTLFTNGTVLDKGEPKKKHDMIEPQDVEIRFISHRKLYEETCKTFGYGFATFKGTIVQVAPYYDEQKVLVAQKLRWPDKTFTVLGDINKARPFGAQAWPPTGKKIVVTEGEIDALSMSQAQGNNWPVVSIACGAGGQIKKYFATHRDYFAGYQEVILMFDSDPVGQRAAVEAAEVLALPYGRVLIAELPLKDPNEMLVAGRVEELVNAMWRAKKYRPGGFVDISEIADKIREGPIHGEPWPWPQLTLSTFGRRPGEIYTLGAGTGIGKTSTWLQVGAEIIRSGRKCGFILHENSPRDGGLRIASAYAGKPFFAPDGSWTQEQLNDSLNALSGKCLLMDTAGSDWDSTEAMIRYWAQAEDCTNIVLDHLSAYSAEEDDDRKLLDKVMSRLSKLTQELQLCVYLITHLKRPMGASHEEGGRVRLDQFRGSNAIAMWSNFAFGLERDQQAGDKQDQMLSTLRVLKDRNTGRGTGDTIEMRYHPELARLLEASDLHGFKNLVTATSPAFSGPAAVSKEDY